MSIQLPFASGRSRLRSLLDVGALLTSCATLTACGEVIVLDAEPAPDACASRETWEQIPTPSFVPKDFGMGSAWGGGRLFVFGDHTSPGTQAGLFDAATDTWRDITEGAPEDREKAVAGWAGNRFLIAGGQVASSGSVPTQDVMEDGLYDPETNTWTKIPAMSPRSYGMAVSTGSEVIVWGGGPLGKGPLSGGAALNVEQLVWKGIDSFNEDKRFLGTAVWTGTQMIVWGGNRGPNLTGGSYHPEEDAWEAIAASGEPEQRESHTAVWAGKVMIVFGGRTQSDTFRSGGVYDPATDTWRPTAEAAFARQWHVALWTGSRMLVFGNSDDNAKVSTTPPEAYDLEADAWEAIPGSTPHFSARYGAWDGCRAILVGAGCSGESCVAETWSYRPDRP